MHDDEKAIIDLTIAYTWALDDRRFEDLREVFAADATGDLAGEHCEGLDAILERIQRGLGKLDATQHVISNQQVRVDGDTATCRCYLVGQHIRHDTPGGDHFIMAGTYSDRWRGGPRAGASCTARWRSSGPRATRPSSAAEPRPRDAGRLRCGRRRGTSR